MARTVEQAATGPSPAAEIPESGVAYLDGEFVPFAEAKVSLAAHALNYGTGVFEGIRGYWNDAASELYLFRAHEHYVRMERSCRLLRVELPETPPGLVEVTRELLRRNAFRSDVYVRPLAFKAGRVMKVALAGIRDGLGLYAFPVGAYLPVDGVKAAIVSWRRIADNAVPARGKLSGAYINTALAVDEANLRGADEAIFLTEDGQVSEGGGANVFLVRDGQIVTTPVSADILEGITRDSIMQLARTELRLPVVERPIDRTELYVADEIFFAGTGAQLAPCIAVDGRPVGGGAVGPVAKALGALYFSVARGDDARRPEWRTSVYS
jgi:branched-chain amino acid aminotransferase